MFDDYLARWDLVPDGAAIITHAARLLPVRRRGEAAILRIATHPEAKDGVVLMRWWDGIGAARVLAIDGDALLLERAQGTRSLADFARGGRDEEATRIICDVAAVLHAPRGKPLPDLLPLDRWFAALWPAAATLGGVFAAAAGAARELLSDPQDVGVLHGDLHHGNILDFGSRGWLAIDPNRIVGERGFDYANLFCNPDIDDPAQMVAVVPECFRCRLDIVTEHAKLDRRRLLKWVLAYCGLSAAWLVADGADAGVDLQIAALVRSELGR